MLWHGYATGTEDNRIKSIAVICIQQFHSIFSVFDASHLTTTDISTVKQHVPQAKKMLDPKWLRPLKYNFQKSTTSAAAHRIKRMKLAIRLLNTHHQQNIKRSVTNNVLKIPKVILKMSVHQNKHWTLALSTFTLFLHRILLLIQPQWILHLL